MDSVKYACVISCRNEEANILESVNAIKKQSLKPSGFIIIDDCSTDRTPEILKKIRDENENVKVFFSRNPRHKIKGYNISSSYNYGFTKLLENFEVDYILKQDADVILRNENYVKELIEIMEDNEFIGLSGGYSDKGRYGIRHISDGARVYKTKCFKEILKDRSPNKGYPIMYGHDTFMLWNVFNSNWSVFSSPLRFEDKRPYIRDNYRSVISGRFHYQNNMPLALELFHILHFHNFRSPKLKNLLSQIILFFSYVIHHLTRSKPYNKEYLEDNYKFWKGLTIKQLKLNIKKIKKRGLDYSMSLLSR